MVEFIFVDIVKKLSILKSNISSTMKTDMSIMRFIKGHLKNQQEKIIVKVPKKILRLNQDMKIIMILNNIKSLNKLTTSLSTKKGKN